MKPKNIGKSFNNIFKINHVFNNEAFATFNLAYLDESFEAYFDEDPLSANYLPGEYRQTGLVSGAGLAIGGTDLFNFKRGSKTLTLKGDVTWQMHRQHEIKAGFEYSDYNMDQDFITILFADEAAFQSDFEAGIVDKVMIFIAPKIIGGRDSVPAVGGKQFRELENAYQLEQVSIKRIAEDILVEGYIKKS